MGQWGGGEGDLRIVLCEEEDVVDAYAFGSLGICDHLHHQEPVFLHPNKSVWDIQQRCVSLSAQCGVF